MLALSALALACLAAPAADAASVTPKIVHGQPAASINDYPFQALVYFAGETPFDGELCGGVITGPTTVITAAHCLFDVFHDGRTLGPSELNVLAGTDDLTTATTSPAVEDPVTVTSFDPDYDPATNSNDVAVLTLRDRLWDEGSTPTQDGNTPIAPIDIIQHSDWLNIAAGDTMMVSGWGDMSVEAGTGTGPGDPGGPTFSDKLQVATVPFVSDSTCASDYSGVNTTSLFCAGDAHPGPIEDSCSGDSGGPIVVDQATSPPHQFVLTGLVDAGNGCAQPGFPGLYTRLDNASLQGFLRSNPPQAPLQSAATSISGGSQPGQTLTCSPGTWNDPDAVLTYQFLNRSGTALTSANPAGTSYTIQQSDQGSRIFCEVKAANAGGYAFGDSTSILVPLPPAPPPPPPPPAKDTTPPKLRINSKECTKTSCTVKVTVRDPGTPSSGVGKVKATLGYSKKVKCRKHGRRATCTKHVRRTLKVRGGSGGKFTIVATRLRPGKGYTVTLIAFDKAGNRPRFSTITNVRTKSRHPHGLF